MRVITVAGLPICLLGGALLAQAPSHAPKYTSAGELTRPGDYREWVFLSSGLGMNYGPASPTRSGPQRFDNVFVTPEAYQAFRETGHWPDKTMLALEVRESSSHGSINKDGSF